VAGGSQRKIRVLFVEDSDDDVQLELAVLRSGGFDPVHAVVDNEQALRQRMAEQSWDLIICDYRMPVLSGVEALRVVKAIDEDVPFILVSGTVGEAVAVDAMRAGAHDYVLKDNLARLAAAVERELRDAQVRRDKRKVERAHRFLAAASATLAESLDYETTLARVARLAVPELGDVCTVELMSDAGCHERVAAQQVAEHTAPLAQQARHIAVPLIARGHVLGRISFGTSRADLDYGPAEMEVATDLASRAALAVDNAKLYQEAQQAVRMRDEFLSIASHELKTPLTAMQLQLQNLRDVVDSGGESGDGRLTARLSRTAQSTERLSFLVESLLDVSRIATGRMMLNLERFDLAEATRDVADRLKEQVQRTGSTLALSGVDSTIGLWDRLRIEQVLVNLLSNAIKYGCGKPIELNVARSGEQALIEVVDHGIGISPADLQRIFGRFERAVPIRHYGGLGLGLYITQQIVAAHGGTVAVTSTPGSGATFTVDLPLEAKPQGVAARTIGFGDSQHI
jgi:signal transduction histidine kinase